MRFVLTVIVLLGTMLQWHEARYLDDTEVLPLSNSIVKRSPGYMSEYMKDLSYNDTYYTDEDGDYYESKYQYEDDDYVEEDGADDDGDDGGEEDDGYDEGDDDEEEDDEDDTTTTTTTKKPKRKKRRKWGMKMAKGD